MIQQRLNHLIMLLLVGFLCFIGSPKTSAFLAVRYPSIVLPIQRLDDRSGHVFELYAKKKKGGNKGNKSQNKESGFEWAKTFSLKPFEAKTTRELASTACASFEGRTGKPLSEALLGSSDIPKALWTAPIACVVVSTVETSRSEDEEGEAPMDDSTLVVKYANRAALETVGLRSDEWERFIATMDQTGNLKVQENPVLIDLPGDMKGDKKYVGTYEKKIMREQGGDGDNDVTIVKAHRWSIEKGVLINGKFETKEMGVAYAWDEWVLGNGIVCRPGGIREEVVDIGALEEAVQEQAAFIRDLKANQGFGNKDSEVLDAVDELIKRKKVLEESQIKK
eukprot:CAMPEP_0198282166 /NCGR_PEP_ID=MMETSP1449-20131203/2012_1 /TAXON_ID=420275 /ORGANISM="Attheya septentrionalis, Strain CCMP2084" /LENGTH=335 /DNA_ID=CAMNT_0043978293 /DNA_START=26 /DNA_END=1033 /DNA_ORIENTATION=+